MERGRADERAAAVRLRARQPGAAGGGRRRTRRRAIGVRLQAVRRADRAGPRMLRPWMHTRGGPSSAMRCSAQRALPGATRTGGAPSGTRLDVERRRFGGTDMDVSVLGFGGSEIGYARTEQEVVDRLLNRALDAGLNVIDTAECYVDSEVAIGRAVSGRRKDYWLFTKVGHWPSEDGWTAKGITRCIERSLERLRTDHLDLVQLHSCGLDVLRRGEVIEAL